MAANEVLKALAALNNEIADAISKAAKVGLDQETIQSAVQKAAMLLEDCEEV